MSKVINVGQAIMIVFMVVLIGLCTILAIDAVITGAFGIAVSGIIAAGFAALVLLYMVLSLRDDPKSMSNRSYWIMFNERMAKRVYG